MLLTTLKFCIAATLITFSSWLAGKRPELAGFIIALPLASMLALAFSYGEYRDPAASITFAKSILVAVPLSLTFFLPFLLADKLNMGFWGLYGLGVVILAAAYFLHRVVMAWLA